MKNVRVRVQELRMPNSNGTCLPVRNAAMQPSNLKPKKRSKRKPSDLTTEEVSNVVSLLKNLVADLDEEDEDGQIVIESVQTPECHSKVIPRHDMFSVFTLSYLASISIVDGCLRSIFPSPSPISRSTPLTMHK